MGTDGSQTDFDALRILARDAIAAERLPATTKPDQTIGDRVTKKRAVSPLR
jgi:hypothetical protein